jgi:hypothetical protein
MGSPFRLAWGAMGKSFVFNGFGVYFYWGESQGWHGVPQTHFFAFGGTLEAASPRIAFRESPRTLTSQAAFCARTVAPVFLVTDDYRLDFGESFDGEQLRTVEPLSRTVTFALCT